MVRHCARSGAQRSANHGFSWQAMKTRFEHASLTKGVGSATCCGQLGALLVGAAGNFVSKKEHEQQAQAGR